MFTKEEIRSVQEEYGGKNFPALVQSFIQLGIVSNKLSILEGIASYQNDLGQSVELPTVKVEEVSNKVNSDLFVKNLKKHQAGDRDFLEFCQDAAQAGVAYWQVDLLGKTCYYFSKDGLLNYEETIPV